MFGTSAERLPGMAVMYDMAARFEPAASAADHDDMFRAGPSSQPPRFKPERGRGAGELQALQEFEATMGPEGFRGLIEYCDECQVDHHCSWAVLQAAARQRLQTGFASRHQPSFEPALLAFVTWEYAGGFVDGVKRRGPGMRVLGDG